MRILDVYKSAGQEVVVNIRMLLSGAVRESRNRSKYKFRLLYHAHGIVSCIYTHAKPNRESWLIAFSAAGGHVLTVLRVESIHKIFVRNTKDYLYYGTFSGQGPDSYKRWVFRGFDISKRRWFADKVYMPDAMGSDLGSTTCFEIFDGYFYGVTNQTCFEIEELDWASYYFCFRFPTDRPGLQYAEYPLQRHMWRRQNAEGAMDDRWTFMKLIKDEHSGDLTILESRKEWLSGRSATRTYYTKKLVFGEDGDDEDEDEEESESDGQCRSTGSLYPINDELAIRLAKEDYVPPPKRNAKDVFVGDDDSAISVMSPLSSYPIRSFHHHDPQTFLDVVNDPSPSDPLSQRVRIRAGSRRLRREEQREERLRASVARYGNSYTLKQEIEDLYDHKEVVFWPREESTASPPLGQDRLYSILNPQGYTGNVHGAWDERSLVYATGDGTSSQGPSQALILISFDPAIRLRGVQGFHDNLQEKMGVMDLEDMPPPPAPPPPVSPPLTKANGKKRQTLGEDAPPAKRSPTSPTSHEPMLPPKAGTWVTYEPALYQKIGRGYHFAR